MQKVAAQKELRAWTINDSIELYNVNGWGRDFFSINDAGDIEVTPGGPGSTRIDLKELVDDLLNRGLNLPLLIRFSDILKIYRERTPLRRNVELAEVADAAIFLLSPASRAVTGEILLVDAGFHVTGI